MDITYCIDLCEIIQKLYKEEPDISRIVARIKEKSKFESCQRIYVGSSFCGPYFLHLKEEMIGNIVKYCESEGIKMTLVIPIFTENNLDKGKKKIETFAKWYGKTIDEVTINDFGMLKYMLNTYKNVKVNIGRLLLKDYREPRYTAYFNTCYKPRVLTTYFKEFIKKYQVNALEFDATHETLDLSEVPEGICIGIHEPYTYMTMGQICQMASIHAPIDQKFRPNRPCKEECTDDQIEYFVDEGRKWLRVGKAIYFEHRDYKVVGISKLRRIYSPFDEEVLGK